MKEFYTIIVFFLVISNLLSQTITWTGAGDGVNWSDKDNWSTGFLPNDGDTVLISNAGNVQMNVSDDVKCMIIENTNFTIQPNILLTLLEGSPFESELILESISTLINQGTIIIESGAIALKIGTGSSFENFNELNIFEANGFGILNYGMLINHDSIIINNTSDNGIENWDSIYNHQGAGIVISNLDSSSTTGVNNVSSASRLINDGLISIFNVEGSGIINAGIFNNQDSVIINQTGGNALTNAGSFTNSTPGILCVKNAIGLLIHGLVNGSSGHFTNEGMIQVSSSNIGIRNAGAFLNYNSILINNIQSDGIRNLDTFINESSALIDIDHKGLFGTGITNFQDDIIINHGVIRISNVPTHGILNSGTIINQDSIIVDSIGFTGFNNQDTLYNSPSGYVRISNAEGLTGGLFNSQSISNYGKIIIADCTQKGFRNDGRCFNYDSLFIDNTEGQGLWNLDTIYNYSPGFIEIQNVSSISSFGIDNWQVDDLFTNEGSIYIFASSGGGITNGGNFIIGPTGLIHTSTIDIDPLIIQEDGRFDCEGLLDINN